jgi:hypothetical protein
MRNASVSEKIAFKNMRQNATEVEKTALDAMVIDNSTDSQNEIVTKMFINVNIFNRNHFNVNTFGNRIMNTENTKIRRYKSWIESTSLYFVITAFPQEGKSIAIFDLFLCGIEKSSFGILSTDRKCIQLAQIYYRFIDYINEKNKTIEENNKNALVQTPFIQIELLNMDLLSEKEFNKKVTDYIKRRDHKFIILCLDTGASITRLQKLFSETIDKQEFNIFKQILIAHDEGDTVTKDENIIESIDGQSTSHNAWIDITKMLCTKVDLKRVFVTATPDSIFMKYPIKCKDVLRLETSKNYRGYKDIEYIDTPYTTTEDEYIELIKKEKTRIVNEQSLEIIIYANLCTIKEQENFTTILVNSIPMEKCIIHTFNCERYLVKIPDEEVFLNFYNEIYNFVPMENWDTNNHNYTYDPTGYQERNGNEFRIPYKMHLPFVFILNEQNPTKIKKFDCKTLPLNLFYDMCKNAGAYNVISVGKDMFNRGISVVGKTRENPFTATILFGRPSKQMHQAGNDQFLNRIAGLARPELPRRMYVPKEISDHLIKYNDNQTLQLNNFRLPENSELLTKDIIDSIEFDFGTSNNIDRKKLKLQDLNIKESEVENNQEGFIDGVGLAGLQAFLEGNTIPAKILRQLCIDDKLFTQEEMYECVEYTNTMEAFKSTLRNGNSIGSNHKKLWITIVENNHYTIKANSRLKKYIIDNNL